MTESKSLCKLSTGISFPRRHLHPNSMENVANGTVLLENESSLEPSSKSTPKVASSSLSKPSHIRRLNLRFDEKCQIIYDYRMGKKKSVIAREHGLKLQTISGILSQENRLREMGSLGSLPLSAKRVRRSHFPEVDNALFGWYQEMLAEHKPLSRLQLFRKANELVDTFRTSATDELLREKYENVIINHSWIDRWKARRNVVVLTDQQAQHMRQLTSTESFTLSTLESILPTNNACHWISNSSNVSSTQGVVHDRHSTDMPHPSYLLEMKTSPQSFVEMNTEDNVCPSSPTHIWSGNAIDGPIPTVAEALQCIHTLREFLKLDYPCSPSTSNHASCIQHLDQLEKVLEKRSDRNLRQTHITDFFASHSTNKNANVTNLYTRH